MEQKERRWPAGRPWRKPGAASGNSEQPADVCDQQVRRPVKEGLSDGEGVLNANRLMPVRANLEKEVLGQQLILREVVVADVPRHPSRPHTGPLRLQERIAFRFDEGELDDVVRTVQAGDLNVAAGLQAFVEVNRLVADHLIPTHGSFSL